MSVTTQSRRCERDVNARRPAKGTADHARSAPEKVRGSSEEWPAMPQVGHRRDRLPRGEMPWCLLLLAVFAGGCVTLTTDGARVSVYRAPLDGLPFQRDMPEGC